MDHTKNMSQEKRNSLLLLASAVVLVLILAMGLPGLVLAPGQPFAPVHSPPVAPGEANAGSAGSDGLLLVVRGLLAVSLILLPAFVVFSLVSREGRRRLLGYALAIAILMLAANYFANLPRRAPIEQPALSGAAPGFDSFGSFDPPATFPATPPPWLTLVIILAVSVVAVVLGLAALFFFRAHSRRSRRSFERLSDQARQAMESLQGGGDVRDAILRCYQEMSRVIHEERGITRAAGMTPREFEQRLVEQGFPRESIQTLTRLFEQVRYGHLATGTDEEQRAYACLAEIANACDPRGALHAQEN